MSDFVIKRKRGEDGYHTFSVRVKQTTVDRLDEIARQTGHTRNALINLFLEYAVEHCVIEGEEP